MKEIQKVTTSIIIKGILNLTNYQMSILFKILLNKFSSNILFKNIFILYYYYIIYGCYYNIVAIQKLL